MAGPLVLLYEVGIWIAHIFGRKENSKTNSKEDEDITVQKQGEIDGEDRVQEEDKRD